MTTTAITTGRGKLTHLQKTGISPKHIETVQVRHESHGDTFLCVAWAYAQYSSGSGRTESLWWQQMGSSQQRWPCWRCPCFAQPGCSPFFPAAAQVTGCCLQAWRGKHAWSLLKYSMGVHASPFWECISFFVFQSLIIRQSQKTQPSPIQPWGGGSLQVNLLADGQLADLIDWASAPKRQAGQK